MKAMIALFQGKGMRVQTGVFGANMQVSLVNDGPITLCLDRSAGVQTP